MGYTDDVKYRVAVFNEMGKPKPITAKPTTGKAIQITGLDQITYVVSALRGQREDTYTITTNSGPKGDFTVAVYPHYTGQTPLSFKSGDWLVMIGQEQTPRLISAEEFRQYWEVS